MFGKKKPAAMLGLDIGSSSVKLLELSRSGTGYQVESHGLNALPRDAVVEASVQDVDGVAATIRELLVRSGTQLQTAAAAVTGTSVFTRAIAMPTGLSEDEMEIQLALEAGQYIPHPLEEVAIDFEIQGPMPDSPGQVQVLLAACRRDTIADRVQAITAAGLQAKVVDLQSHAMERAFVLVDRQLPAAARDLVALLDIGATTTTFSVLGNGRTLYTRDQLFGGRSLTEAAMARHGLSAREADLAIRNGELPPALLEPFRVSVIQQLERALQFFFSSSNHRAVNHIVLAGGAAATSGLQQLVETQMATPCTVANPFSGMELAAPLDRQALDANAPALLIACGLALRSFD